MAMIYIPDNPDLYEYLKGIEYLNFIADVYEIDSETRTRRIEKYARVFELYDELANQISSYSHGMKQKLALISAFIHEPKLIIMDEPFVGLDPKAIFFSTHVLEVAEKLCDRVAIIKNGKLLKEGVMEKIVGDDSLEEVFLELEGEDDVRETD